MLRSPTRRIFLAFLSLVAAAVVYVQQGPHLFSVQPKHEAVSDVFTVQRVIDGDTFILSNGEKVRLTGIDTPESRVNPKAIKDSQRSGEDLGVINKKGKEATRFFRQLAEGKQVRLEYDVQKRDKYGRLLVYAYDVETLKTNPQLNLQNGMVVAGNKEIFLNGSIVSSGYATPLTIPPNVKYAALFKQLYAEARAQQRGLWAQNYP